MHELKLTLSVGRSRGWIGTALLLLRVNQGVGGGSCSDDGSI